MAEQNFGINCALADIKTLEEEGLISPELAQRGRDFVGLTFQGNTVYATISPIDGEDLCFYWVGGKKSLTAILYSDENKGWYCTNLEERRSHEGGTPRWFWDDLAAFTDAVDAVNPEWHLLRGDV